MEEIWKDIPNFIGLYQTSNWGRIKSFQKGKERILKLFKDKDGYMHIKLCKDGKIKYFSVHRLVYETFVGSIPDGMQVNHINEVKTDNFVFVNSDGSVDLQKSNLNIMTPKENVNWGTGIKRNAENHFQAVLQLTYPEGKFIKEWSSMTEASKNGYNIVCISNCCNGISKHHKGYMWIKKNERRFTF